MTHKLSITDLQLEGKRVLMRVDFNVPIDKSGKIINDSRIVASLPSINYVLNHGGSLILMSHLGRPKGKSSPEFSLAPCAKRLSGLLQRPVKLAPDCVGQQVEGLVKELKPGEVILLENLRFHDAEEHPEKDSNFAHQLAKLGNLYVNDAFGTAHRKHASTYFVPQCFPNAAAAGFLLQKEIDFLGRTFENPERPFYAIIGGAKISSKLGVLKTLIKKVDGILIGGGMAFTFFKALGFKIGNSIHEDNLINEAKEILKKAQDKKVPILLPDDTVVVQEVKNGAPSKVVQISEGIPDGYEGVDIGPETIRKFISFLRNARTIFWNGPLGVFEIPAFAKGSQAIAHVLAGLPANTIIGGGESVAAVEQAGLADKMSHVSTGGGASLEYIEFGTLPGIEVLTDKL